ncbi:MAG: NUDIX domain-containing protein [Acidimicrobiales bacterium]
MVTSYDRFLRELAKERRVRVRVAGLCVDRERLLVQQAADEPTGVMALPGGGLQLGASLEQQLAQEFAEETTAQLRSARYLFVVEHTFRTVDGELVHSLEHYFAVELDRSEVRSKESHLIFSWVPIEDLSATDLRPRVVRDTITSGDIATTKHLVEMA